MTKLDQLRALRERQAAGKRVKTPSPVRSGLKKVGKAAKPAKRSVRTSSAVRVKAPKRPKQTRNGTLLQFWAPADWILALDMARGATSRSAYIRERVVPTPLPLVITNLP